MIGVVGVVAEVFGVVGVVAEVSDAGVVTSDVQVNLVSGPSCDCSSYKINNLSCSI